MSVLIKDTKEYVVENFIYHEINQDQLIVQNKHGIVRITQQNMIEFIKKLDTMSNSVINEELFNGHFNSHTEDAIKFLIDYRIIKANKEELNFNLRTIKFYTNHNELHEITRFLINKDPSRQIEVVQSEDFTFNPDDLIIIFLNPYDKKTARKIVNEINRSNAILMMSYVYNNKVFFDSLYRKKWRNPCHFCHMGHIESQLRVSETGELTYQHLIDMIYHENNSFKVETPLDSIEITYILSILFKQLDKFITRDNGRVLLNSESLYEINNSIMFDLLTKQKSIDTSIYWELCDCYE